MFDYILINHLISFLCLWGFCALFLNEIEKLNSKEKYLKNENVYANYIFAFARGLFYFYVGELSF